MKASSKYQNRHAILLDLDGTIVTTSFRNTDAKTEALELLERELGISNLSLKDHIRDYFLCIKSANIPERKRKRIASMLSGIIERYEIESVERCRLKDGAVHFIEQFHNRIPMAIVSNSGKEAVRISLERFGLADRFEIILHRNNMPDLKPSAAGLEIALKRLKVKPQDAVMIGDAVVDVMASHNAGVTSIALIDGVASKDDLESLWPDFIAKNLKQSAELIKRLWSI